MKSAVSVRDALGPARVRLRGGLVLAELTGRFGAAARTKVLSGEVVDHRGAVVGTGTVLPAGSVVYLYRDLPKEVPVPFEIPVLYQDGDLVVVDKPHFLATKGVGTSCRPRSFDCGAPRGCPNSARPIGWIG